MGITKAMMEKVMVATSRNLKISDTVICCTRYGNVMASRGSVIPLFVSQVLANKPITVTELAMTRFMMTLEDAVDLVIYAFKHGKNGEIFIQKSPAVSLQVLIQALLELMDKPQHNVNCIGTRHGEKLFEVLLSREEMLRSIELGNYFCIPPDGRDLNYNKFIDQGEMHLTQKFNPEEYHSHNAMQLNVKDMKELLLKLDFIRRILQGESASSEA
jgi:UDP-glucose 4-epimerase